MRGYFGLGQLSATEKSDILNQHKSVYNGYQTMQPQVSNTQPLTVYDFAGDKEGLVVNNKGEVKKYTNMGINEQVETKEVCDDCGAMIMDGMCTECNYGHMEEEMTEGDGEVCECGGTMYEGMCNECGSGYMEEETGHLDDIYHEEDLNPTAGFDYIQGSSNDVDTFEGMHKNLYKEQDEFVNYDENMEDDDDFQDYESSYTEDGVEDPDNEDDGYEDLNASEVTDGELDELDIADLVKGKRYKYNHPLRSDEFEFDSEHKYPEGEDMYSFRSGKTGYAIPGKQVKDYVSHLDDEEFGSIEEQGGNVDDMDDDDVQPAYNFDSNGPGDVYPVNELDEDDMYAYEPMESAWADDDEVKEGVNSPAYKGPEGYDDSSDSYPDELDEQPDISGVQGIYGAMDRAYDFDSDGPGKGGPYQEFSYESELDEDEDFTATEDDFEEVEDDLKESFMTQRNRIMEMFNRFNKYN
jgi:hypothetical protein